MLKRSAAAVAVVAAMAIGGSGVALASNGADDPAPHHQGKHHKQDHGRHHHGKGAEHGPNHP
ncbi:MAG TPA: hypothetical protein VHM66_10975 [Solirubrobacterales bacterium]|nr:hypothetical protein [Solirubrobacterales bacterium]